MNLQQTVEALEFNHIMVALDIGVHQSCDVDSNCPIAVELRRIITASGVTLEQLLEGYDSLTQVNPEPIPVNITEISGKATIVVAGQEIPIDLTPVIQSQLTRTLKYKIEEINNYNSQVSRLGQGLYSSYLNQIYNLRNTKTMPQLEFSEKDLIKAGCYITTDGDYYIFLFPRVYCPQYIVTDGIRYELSQADKDAIKRDIVFEFKVTKDNRIFKPIVLDSEGDKFSHYHGRNGDCWGMMRLPERWDGRLRSLTELIYQVTGALYTINKDSILERQPVRMPHVDLMLERVTRLGEEGHIEERVRPEGAWTTEAGETAAPRAWGRRT